jgi:hypothetical protein
MFLKAYILKIFNVAKFTKKSMPLNSTFNFYSQISMLHSKMMQGKNIF